MQSDSSIRSKSSRKPTSIAKGGSGRVFIIDLPQGGSSVRPSTGPQYDSKVEEGMVNLFRPPTVDGLKKDLRFDSGISGSPGGCTQSDSDSDHDELAPLARTGNARDLSAHLDEVEVEFMNANYVATASINEKDLVQRYDKTEMPEQPQDTFEYMTNLVDTVVKESIHCGAPTMIGHMTTSLPYYMRPLSKLVTTMHANNVKVETGKSTTFIEKEALAMLHRELFHLTDEFYATSSARPDTTLGVVTSGGTIANNTAMWIARNKLLPADGKFNGCDKSGMLKGMLHHGYTSAVIIGSEVMHYSMKKSADVLGIGTEGLLTCSFTEKYQVNVDEMRRHVEECVNNNVGIISLVGVAGGTETGSIDDLNAIADLAEEYGIHFHVDAAWGGPVIFSEKHRHKISGIERADTVTLDGHKQLYTPMGCGLCFLRNPDQIKSVEKTANYIIRKDSYDLGKFTMEGSRPAVSLYLHANLEILGVQGYAALVDRSIRLVQFMVTSLRETKKFETVLDPMTNILLYRYLPESVRAKSLEGIPLSAEENAECDRVNVALQNKQKITGSTFVSRTTIFSPVQKVRVVGLRVVIANPLTNEEHILATLNDQLDIVASIDA